MLFNATQAEELRVAIVDGQKLLDLDIESSAREQRKGNIYKASISRIEHSLEACFVDYGVKRHGFLPFKEISHQALSGNHDQSRPIADVLKEGQELIVQVEKDERSNKGASMTTFVSLAGRYLVLMPTNSHGGGISRRINTNERNELHEAMDQLQLPAGMSVIARTASIGRAAESLQWDLNYLISLWEAVIRESDKRPAPFLIYHDSSLVIRAIRDYFQPDIAEILVDTDEVFQQAQRFMTSVMPDNVDRIKRYNDDVPLFSRFQIEHQIESAYSREVNLPSGGTIVIDHTEALISIDINSRRATRGQDIEDTALQTNLEAVDEIARQMRLRDLGGLIVIDFIDMGHSKNQREVEARLRDALRHDRARIHVEHISSLGLLELSRQRLRQALVDESQVVCPRCTGTGHIRSTESFALNLLRLLEEKAMKENTGAVHALLPLSVASYLLNEKRFDVQALEVRHKVNLMLIPTPGMEVPNYKIARLRHDQLDQEDQQKLSFEIQEVQESLERKNEVSKIKPPPAEPKMQAALKQIHPSTPPPPQNLPAPVQAAPSSGGLFARIASWFGESKGNNSAKSMSGEGTPVSATPIATGRETNSRRPDEYRRKYRSGYRRDRGRRGGRRGSGGGNSQRSADS